MYITFLISAKGLPAKVVSFDWLKFGSIWIFPEFLGCFLFYKNEPKRIRDGQIEDSKYLLFSVKRKALNIFLKNIKIC